jgi:hypothetical protein
VAKENADKTYGSGKVTETVQNSVYDLKDV